MQPKVPKIGDVAQKLVEVLPKQETQSSTTTTTTQTTAPTTNTQETPKPQG